LRGGAIPKERVLAIGDGVATDIAGAGNFGIRSVFIASGVYVTNGEAIGDAAARLFAPAMPQPVAVMDAFVW
jgi:ribonucleotide monophosphatase NagD (HAD superfamily)